MITYETNENGDSVKVTTIGNTVIREIDRLATALVFVNLAQWFIDIGPFYDRFGSAKMAVLTSADATVKAILSDVSIRKWIDLKRSDVALSLAYIGSVVPALTSTLQTAILTTPVTADENRATRKSYF